MRRLPHRASPLRSPLLLRPLPDARLAEEVGAVSVEIVLRLNGVPVPVTVDDVGLGAIAAAVADRVAAPTSGLTSPYMTVEEAAEYLRCGYDEDEDGTRRVKRQRVDDLLSQRRLTRIKDGSRTLVLRSEIEQHLHHDKRRRP